MVFVTNVYVRRAVRVNSEVSEVSVLRVLVSVLVPRTVAEVFGSVGLVGDNLRIAICIRSVIGTETTSDLKVGRGNIL